jgi:hypothetical protein
MDADGPPTGGSFSKLPLILEADGASEPFLLAVDPRSTDIFEDALGCRRIDTLELEDARGNVTVHSLPDLHRSRWNAETNQGLSLGKSTP